MSIITTAQAVPSRLFAIYAALFDTESGEPKDRLEARATPPSLAGRGADEDGEPSTTLFSNTLQEARRLGLVEEVDDKLRLTVEARGGGKRGQPSEVYFRAYLSRTLFDSTRAIETGQSAFMVALSWFLSANPLTPMSFAEPPQIGLKLDIGDQASKTELTSLNRYQNFLYWARYLGFATIVGGRDDEATNSRRAVPDPSRAIASALTSIFSDGCELAIETFLNRLSALYPVFEKGSIRLDYDSMRLTPPVDGGHRLSIASSLALQRLEDRQLIGMTSVADAPTRVLDFGRREGRVSHVSLKGAA
jgi:hypothetical protein